MLIALSGPSGIGKGFIKERLMELYPLLRELPWLTTRPLRLNEVPGRNRVHVTQVRFDELAASGECVLVQNLYGYAYGLERQYVQPSVDLYLTELHPDNITAALALTSEIALVGLITDDYALLEDRLEGRGDGLETTASRLVAAKAEVDSIRRQHHFFRLVVTISRETVTSATDEVVETIGKILERKGD